MQSYQDYLFSTGSSIIPVGNASVTVYLHGTQTAASIFSDSGGVNPITNPFLSNAQGFFDFYAANGRYDLFIAWSGQFASKLDIILFDPANGAPLVQVGGTIDNAVIGGTTPAAGHFTTLSATTPLPVTSGGTGVATSTGAGSNVLSISPALVTPALGTPTAGVLTSCTGLPVATGISGLGAGVATALALAANGSGAVSLTTSPSFVTPALGTPTAGVLTSCTGLPVSTGVTGMAAFMASPGPIGSTAASTGAFTTLSASGAVSGAGFSTYLASPPAIGGTVAAAGSFSTLSASGLATLNGTELLTPQAAPGSPASGTIWQDSGQNSLTSFNAGLKLWQSGTFFTATADAVTSGTTASSWIGTGVGTTTLPVNFLVAGKTIRISGAGTLVTAASPGTTTLILSLGGVTIASSATAITDPSIVTAAVTFDFFITCRTTGSSGTVVASGNAYHNNGAGLTTTGLQVTSSGAVTINTTTTQAIALTTTNSIAAGAVYTIKNLIMQVLA